MPIDFRLLIQLTIKSPAALKNYAVKHELEVFAVSETWLRSDNKFSADKVCSTGYCFLSCSTDTLTRWRSRSFAEKTHLSEQANSY